MTKKNNTLKLKGTQGSNDRKRRHNDKETTYERERGSKRTKPANEAKYGALDEQQPVNPPVRCLVLTFCHPFPSY